MTTQVVLATPYTPPAPPTVIPWNGVRMTWQGWDGSLWGLDGNHAAGICMQSGVRGLTMPPFLFQESTSDSRDGVRWRSSRTDKRPVVWPLWVWNDGSDQAWLEYDRAFWATMNPTKPGLWTVTQPSGESRTMVLRFVDDDSQAWDKAPGMRAWTPYLLDLQAEDPYWHGAAITRAWSTGNAVDFFDADGSPAFHISEGATFGSATISNPGDVPAWPTWTVTGPCTSITVGVNGRLVTYEGTVAAGDTLTVNSLAMTAKVGATNVTQNLTVRDFAPIPEGSDKPLTVAMTGTGTVSVTLTPLYYRAW